MTSGDDLAFPVMRIEDKTRFVADGLTKRELAAFMAMQGLCSTFTIGRDQPELQTATAESAVKYADALLAALAPKPERAPDDEL